MSHRFVGTGLLTAAILSLPLFLSPEASAQKKKAPEPAKKPDSIDSGKFAPGEFFGVLKETPGTDRMFLLECQQDRLVPTGGGGFNPANVPTGVPAPNLAWVQQTQQRIIQAQQHIKQAQSKLSSAKTAQDTKTAQADLDKAKKELSRAQSSYKSAVTNALYQANVQTNAMILAAVRNNGGGLPSGFRVDKAKQLVEFQASEAVKVRTLFLAEKFDDKGNPVKYTKDELATLKGKDKTLPGYESALEKLGVGQKVRVALVPAPKKPADKNADAEEKDPMDKADKKMQVKLILILDESTGTTESPKEKGKKK